MYLHFTAANFRSACTGCRRSTILSSILSAPTSGLAANAATIARAFRCQHDIGLIEERKNGPSLFIPTDQTDCQVNSASAHCRPKFRIHSFEDFQRAFRRQGFNDLLEDRRSQCLYDPQSDLRPIRLGHIPERISKRNPFWRSRAIGRNGEGTTPNGCD